MDFKIANYLIKTHIFYLPFYFQAVKGTTAEQSGIRTIPYLGSIIISSIIVGGGITVIGCKKSNFCSVFPAPLSLAKRMGHAPCLLRALALKNHDTNSV